MKEGKILALLPAIIIGLKKGVDSDDNILRLRPRR